MNFERGKKPNVALGIGDLGRHGLHVDLPYIKSSALQIHVKDLVVIISQYYLSHKIPKSIFQFPVKREVSHPSMDNWPDFVITAEPGEPTDYESIYRKIDYPEIITLFFRLTREVQFNEFLFVVDLGTYKFLGLYDYI